MIHIMENLYEKLKVKFGDHSKVALALGLTPRQYRRIRSGESGLKETLRHLMILVLEDKKRKH